MATKKPLLIRIVKMTFESSQTEAFLQIYQETHQKIRNREGCRLLELYCDKNDPDVFITYSYWDSEEYLEAYRNSELFKSVWQKTKQLFRNKAEAWSMYKFPYDSAQIS
jgi:quinol monooxygenase YgiN